jgi:rubrerythrin
MPRKRTTEEIDQLASGKPVIRIGAYINYDTPIDWQCTICAYIWKARPAGIITKGSACPKCSHIRGGRLKSEREWIRRVEPILKMKEISLIGQFSRVKDKHTFRCNICEYHWITMINNIVNNGTGCPRCAEQIQLTNDIVDQRLKALALPIRRIGYVVNARDKITFECGKGHKWDAPPYSILSAQHGCSLCNRKGTYSEMYFRFHPERKQVAGRVYLVKFSHNGKIYLKVGLTKNSIRERLKRYVKLFEEFVIVRRLIQLSMMHSR